MLAGLAALLSAIQVRGLTGLVMVSMTVGVGYLAIMLPVLRTPPLGAMLTSSIQPWVDRAHPAVRRLAGQPATLSN